MKLQFFGSSVLILSIAIISCKQQDDYKKIRTAVVNLHDKVMQNADLANSQQKSLDSVYQKVKPLDSLKIRSLISEIDQANHEMEEWMARFEPDVSGKDNNESVTYFKSELLKIKTLDQHYKQVMIQADHYLDSLQVRK